MRPNLQCLLSKGTCKTITCKEESSITKLELCDQHDGYSRVKARVKIMVK